MRFLQTVRVAFGAAAFSCLVVGAKAQTASAQTTEPTPTTGAKSRQHVNGRRLALIVKKMSEDSGAKIECDDSVASEYVVPPPEATTTANFESQIDGIVARLPKGSTWAKLYMPVLPKSTYRANDLADYAMAESRLFGTVGAALPSGTIEVLGQKLSADKAASVGQALNLRPIYIITNTLARRQTPQQRAKALLAMTPDQREEAIGAMMSESADVMREMFSEMSPEDRQAMMAKGMKFSTVTPDGGQASIIIRSRDDGTPPPP